MRAAELMTDLAILGIELQAHGDQLRFRPRSGVTPDLAKRMAACKSELLTLRTGVPYWPEVTPEANEDYWTLIDEADREYLLAPRERPDQCARCGGRTTWRDVPIHDGQSVRRDCARCGRFIAFKDWHGKPIEHQQEGATRA